MTLGDLEIKQDSDWEDIVYFATNTPNGTFTYNGNEYTVCSSGLAMLRRVQPFIGHPRFMPFFRDVVAFSIGITPPAPKGKTLLEVTQEAVVILYALELYKNEYEYFIFKGHKYKFNYPADHTAHRKFCSQISTKLFLEPVDFTDFDTLKMISELANQVHCEEM